MKQLQISTKTSRDRDLKLTIYSLISKGFNPTRISKELKIQPSALQYHLSTMKKLGMIKKIAYGTWEVTGDFNEKQLQKTSSIANTPLANLKFSPDTIRGHGFSYKLKIPTIKNWEKREEILKKNNISFKKFNHLKGTYQINYKGRKIWLTNESIIVYEKHSFSSYGTTASESEKYAISEFIALISSLEAYLGTSFRIRGEYQFKISRKHYALIKNSLAHQYQKNGEKLNVRNESGQWLLIDNSNKIPELELVHPITSKEDTDEVVLPFWNGLKAMGKDAKDFTPQFVLNTMTGIQNNQMMFAENMKSHIEAVQRLGKGVEELTAVVKELKK